MPNDNTANAITGAFNFLRACEYESYCRNDQSGKVAATFEKFQAAGLEIVPGAEANPDERPGCRNRPEPRKMRACIWGCPVGVRVKP